MYLAFKKFVYDLVGFADLEFKYSLFNKINSKLIRYINLLYRDCRDI